MSLPTFHTTLLACRPPEYESLFPSALLSAVCESSSSSSTLERDVDGEERQGHYEPAPHLVRQSVGEWKGQLRGTRHRLLVETAIQTRTGTLVARTRGPNPPLMMESMPIYVRMGIRLLFGGQGKERGKVLRSKEVEELFRRRSVAEGIKFDSTRNTLRRIEHFIRAYDVDISELLEPRLNRYKTLNHFFYRRLRASARPVAQEAEVVVSAADCRLTVYEDIESAQEYWIKGRNFAVNDLLQDDEMAEYFRGGELAIFRLAPKDYHRFHSPVDAVVGETISISGQYLTVQPMVVNNPSLDVFTENRRDVTYLHVSPPSRSSHPPKIVAYVQIGAMLVGSIHQTVQEGQEIQRGDEIGYFAYGGSTIVVVFPRRSAEFSPDLLVNSRKPVETLVKMGEEIGRSR